MLSTTRTPRVALLAILALALLAVPACGSDDDTGTDPDIVDDATGDASDDTVEPDADADAGTDAPPDVTPDAGPDTPPDTPPDVQPEVEPDVPVDADTTEEVDAADADIDADVGPRPPWFPLFEGAPPMIPHDPFGCGITCLNCHETGTAGAPVTHHPERESCSACHLDQQDVAPWVETTFIP